MPQIGWFEILIIVAVAIIVIGPKDFPIMLKKVGSWIGTIKRHVNKFQEEVSILGHKRTLLLIEERILNSYIRWEHTNKYWVDEKTGYVWQSLQMIAPNLPPISIQITKKPS